VDERGSAYFPQVNAFYVREFQMMHATEDAARFLHQACMGLPHHVDKKDSSGSSALAALDNFNAGMMEHALSYFGSRVLYPSRTNTEGADTAPLSRVACEKEARTAIRAGVSEANATAQKWGYRIGNEIYRAYLAGKVSRNDLRQLFLAHLYDPGVARKVCGAMMAKLRMAGRKENGMSRQSEVTPTQALLENLDLS